MPIRVDAVLSQVLEKHGVDKRVRQLTLLEQWPEIVGEKLAEVTHVRGVDDRALFIEVRSSAWLMELSMMKNVFLDRVNATLEETPLERIVFVLAETT